jgi:hypothetical protein
MVNNHSILKLLKEILVNSNNLKKSYSSLDETVEFFNYLNSTKKTLIVHIY